MKTPPPQSDSLKKALEKSRVFDEADYYKSKTVELGGEEDDSETEEEDEDDDKPEDLG